MFQLTNCFRLSAKFEANLQAPALVFHYLSLPSLLDSWSLASFMVWRPPSLRRTAAIRNFSAAKYCLPLLVSFHIHFMSHQQNKTCCSKRISTLTRLWKVWKHLKIVRKYYIGDIQTEIATGMRQNAGAQPSLRRIAQFLGEAPLVAAAL